MAQIDVVQDYIMSCDSDELHTVIRAVKDRQVILGDGIWCDALS